MITKNFLAKVIGLSLFVPTVALGASLKEQNEALLSHIAEVYHLTADQMAKLRQKFESAPYMGQ